MQLEKLEEKGIGYLAHPQTCSPEKPLLAMIHGAGGAAETWLLQLGPLEKWVNAVAIDLPGHGKTPGKGYDSVADYAKWVIEALETISGGPIYLMGHSMGGAIVQEVALMAPELIKGIVLVCTGARLKVAPLILEGLEKEFTKTVELIVSFAYSKDTDPKVVAEGARLMAQAGKEVLLSDFLACHRFDATDELPNLRVPCLIIAGEHDKLTPIKLSQELHQLIPESTLHTIPSSAHMPMVENPLLFNRVLAETPWWSL